MNIQWLIDKITDSSKNYPEKIFTEKNRIYTCINSYKYHIFHRDPTPYQQMDGIFVDGIFMCNCIKLFWGKNIHRLSFDMTSMAKDLFPRLCNTNETIFFIGDEEEMIKQSVSQIAKSYPEMRIIGFRNGFFENDIEREEAIDKIVKMNPDFVIVGMGGKLQEQFLFDLKKVGFNGIGMSCGGFFHQANEQLQYYPTWVNKYNLRACYRMIKEKTYKRLIHLIGTFPLFFILDTLSSKIRISHNNK